MHIPWLHPCAISRQLDHFSALLHDVSSWLFQWGLLYYDVSCAMRLKLRHGIGLTFDCHRGRTAHLPSGNE